MKPSDPLDSLLHEWRVDKTLPPRFRDDVWARIARADHPSVSGWDRWREWLAQTLPRPALATAYMASLLALGVSAGLWRAQVKDQSVQEQLAVRYVQAVDPYRALHP